MEPQGNCVSKYVGIVECKRAREVKVSMCV